MSDPEDLLVELRHALYETMGKQPWSPRFSNAYDALERHLSRSSLSAPAASGGALPCAHPSHLAGPAPTPGCTHPPELGAEGRALSLLVRARPVMFLECPDPQQMERLIAVKDEIDALLRAEGGKA